MPERLAERGVRKPCRAIMELRLRWLRPSELAESTRRCWLKAALTRLFSMLIANRSCDRVWKAEILLCSTISARAPGKPDWRNNCDVRSASYLAAALFAGLFADWIDVVESQSLFEKGQSANARRIGKGNCTSFANRDNKRLSELVSTLRLRGFIQVKTAIGR